jgi:hypothetical protein
MSDAYQRNLETNVSKLIESYKTILKKSALDNTHAPHENLQITAAAAAIVRTYVFSCHFKELNQQSYLPLLYYD